jgi:hypothetical protein
VASAQGDCQFGEVVIPFEGLRHVGDDGLQIIQEAHEVDMAHAQPFGVTGLGANRNAAKATAIGANLLVRHDDQGFLGQAFLEWRRVAFRQVTRFNQPRIKLSRPREGQCAIGGRLKL